MYVFRRRPSRWIAVAVALAATAAAGGVAWAVTARIDRRRTEIHGCVNTRTGALRVILRGKTGAAARCHRRERPLSWNQAGLGYTGPRGPRGPIGPAGPQGPGAVEYTFSLGVGQTQTLGAAGPFELSAACTTSSGETDTELLATNTATVNYNETTISPGEPPPSDLSMNSASVPPEAVPFEFDVIASSTGAQRQTERMLTPPSPALGQLNDMIYVSPGGCSGSVIWIPAS